jgi:hypothetical protein
MSEAETLARWRRMGELEGAAFDAALVARDRAQRSERLSRVTLAEDAADLAPAEPAPGGRRDVAELESRLRELAQFHAAVTTSRSWKLLQRLRGLVGRAW